MKYYVKHAKCLSLVVGTVMLFAFGAAHAAVSEQQASRLGKDLTPWAAKPRATPMAASLPGPAA